MHVIHTMYILLRIRDKIPNKDLRLLYLKDIWGLPQDLIGECEGYSQSKVSKHIKESRITLGKIDVKSKVAIQFSPEEIAQIQNLPREMISDAQVIAFVNDILKLKVSHLFYLSFNHNVNFRIAALHKLGLQQTHLKKVFGKSQPAISMIVKRDKERSMKIERPSRYDLSIPLIIEVQSDTVFINDKRRFFVASQ